MTTEAIKAAASSPVSTILVTVVAAVICLASLVTVGRNAAQDSAIQEALSGPEGRLITVSASGERNEIDREEIESIASLNYVDRIVATGSVVDTTNSVLGATIPVPAFTFSASESDLGQLVAGRWPRDGEAIIGVTANESLRMVDGVGALQTRLGKEFPVVGIFSAEVPFERLNSSALIASEAGSVYSLYVTSTSAETSAAVSEAINEMLVSERGRTISTTTGLAEVRSAMEARSLASDYGRSTLLLILAAGAAFIIAVVFSDVLSKRRDIGRRRALGCSKAGLVYLVVARTGVGVLVGVILGTVAGYILAARESPVPIDFTIGLGVLTIVVALLASTIPATIAANRDPVSVLRTA